MSEPGSAPGSAPDSAVAGLKRLERELAVTRTNGAKATRQMHGALIADLRKADRRRKAAEARADVAEKAAAKAERRARRAVAELEQLKASSTWKAGRAVVAVPARLKRLRRS